LDKIKEQANKKESVSRKETFICLPIVEETQNKEIQNLQFDGVFWTKFEHFSSKTQNDCALRAQN